MVEPKAGSVNLRMQTYEAHTLEGEAAEWVQHPSHATHANPCGGTYRLMVPPKRHTSHQRCAGQDTGLR